MHIFVLVDLPSQLEFIPPEIRASRETFLAWLKQHGKVSHLYQVPDFSDMYIFCSPWDIESRVVFFEDGDVRVYAVDQHLTRGRS